MKPRDPHSQAIVRLLGRARRRAFVCAWARYAGGALVLLAAALVAWLALRESLPDLGLVSGVAATAVVLAAVGAFWRTPSPLDAARSIDDHLGLEQRLETALEGLAEADEMARLLRRDALSRVGDLALSRLYPLAFGGGRRFWWAPAALLAAALVARVGGPPSPGTRMAWVTGTPPAAAVGAEDGAEAPPSGSAAPDATLPVGADAAAPATPAAGAGEPTGDSGSARGGRSSAPGEPPSPAAGGEETTPPRAIDPAPSPGRSPADGLPAPAAGSPPRPGATQPPPVAARPAVGGGRNGSGDGPGEPPGWGAGTGGAPLALPGAAPSGPWTLAEPAGGGGAAAGGSGGGGGPQSLVPGEVAAGGSIDSVLAGETLPPGLERFVRAYFAAIRGAGGAG